LVLPNWFCRLGSLNGFRDLRAGPGSKEDDSVEYAAAYDILRAADEYVREGYRSARFRSSRLSIRVFTLTDDVGTSVEMIIESRRPE
jgi:hypothetical protein